MIARRFAILFILMFWQGGFLFYGTVVVTVGANVLGSDREQGFITQQVSSALNIVGGVALLALAIELATGRDYRIVENRKTRRNLWVMWGIQVVAVVILVVLHPRMDALMDSDEHIILDRPGFRSLHRWYLRIWTLLWLTSMLYLVGLLRSWKRMDRVIG